MASEIGKAYVQIVPSARGISGKIQQELNGSSLGSDVGSTFGKGFGGAAVAAVAALGIGMAIRKTISDSLSQGMELEQNLGGTEAVFGDYANNIQETAKTAYKNMGLSASEYMATANKMGSLFQGSGMSQVRSLELTTEAMQRASDVASVMGISQEMAMESIAGAAKGNFTMMDNLGVAMNATTIKAYALEKGINFDWNTASNAEKAEIAMKMFMDRTSQYSGNFARESTETLSGAIGMVQASWKDFLGNLALGENVGQSLSNLVSSGLAVLTNAIPMVVNIITELPGAIMEAWPSIVSSFQQMGADIVSNIAGGTDLNMGEILDKGIAIITGFTNSIFENLPQLITTAGTMISTLAGAIMTNLPTILEKGVLLIAKIAEGFIQNLPAIVAALLQMFNNIQMTIISHLPEMIEGGLKLIGKLVAGIIRAIPEVIRAMVQIHDAIKNSLKNVDWAELGKNIIRGIVNGIKALASEVTGAIKDVVNKGLQAAKEALGIASPSKVFRDEVGKWIPAGVAVGIQANTQDVTGAIEDMKAQAINASQMQISTTYSEEAIREREERMDAIVGMLATYLPECATPTVIDGESMMETINTQLGLGVI